MPPQLTIVEKTKIVTLFEEGLSVRTVAERVGKPRSTVHRIHLNWRATQNLQRRPGSGASVRTTQEQDNNLIHYLEEHPFQSATEAKINTGFPASVITARRRVKRLSNLRCRRAAKKPFLTNQNKEQRVGWCLEFLRADELFWRRVIFSDEKIFQSYPNGGLRVYRPPGSRFEEIYTQKIEKTGRFSVNVWGCMGAGWAGVCTRINGRFNTEQYLNILGNIMLPNARIEYPDGFVFQQDNCPIHTARRVGEWMEANRVQLLPWPSRSPDANPLENVWGMMVKRMSNFKPENEESLWLKIVEVWNSVMTQQLTENLVDSMPRRVHAILEKNGSAIKY